MFEVSAEHGRRFRGPPFFKQRYLLTYFLPRENNDIANVSLSGSQKGSNLRLKCARIRLTAGLRLDPLGELMHSLRPLAAMRGLLLREEG